jgi:hypothetical protein
MVGCLNVNEVLLLVNIAQAYVLHFICCCVELRANKKAGKAGLKIFI